MTYKNTTADEPPVRLPSPRIPLGKLGRIVGVRLFFGFMTLLMVSIVIFGAVYMLPGDAAEILVGPEVDPMNVEILRRQLGLDRPVVLRYFDWIAGIVQGDFGMSLSSGIRVSELIGQRFANTLYLALYAAAIVFPTSFVISMAAVLRPESWPDRLANMLALILLSTPSFLKGYVLILFLSVRIPIFPSSADVTPDMDWAAFLYVAFLPAITLSMVGIGYMVRMTRAAMLDVMQQQYIRMARLKGLSPRRVVLRHALPNAVGSIANVAALVLAYMILGVVIVETVFAYPGLGRLLVDSVSVRDVTVVQSISLIFACVYVLLNLAADITAIVTNPRILHPRN